jgi:hypothetical protein
MRADLSNRIVLRWDSGSDCAALLASGGIETVWLTKADDRVASACRAAGAETLAADEVHLLPLDQASQGQSDQFVAVKAGVWPGAQASGRGSGGGFSAGATQHAWVDSNTYLPALIQALYPAAPPVLGYLPDADAGISGGKVIPYNSLELALIDAWTGGGNYILAPDADCRDALLAGDHSALAAWSSLGRTARWLREHQTLFRQPPMGAITVLVEPGDTTSEIAALLFRHSGSPELVPTARVPAPDPAHRPVVVAAGIHPPSADLRKLLLAHASAGATVVTDLSGADAWWRTAGLKPSRAFEDREFYSLGSGTILAYKQAIDDPGDFALDVLDVAGARRAVRIWECPAGIATVSQAGPRSKPVLRVVNYASRWRDQMVAHVRGNHSSATLLRPGQPPVALKTYRRGPNTEVALTGLERLAVVVFN